MTPSDLLWRTLQDYNGQIGALTARLSLLLAFNAFTVGLVAPNVRALVDGLPGGWMRAVAQAVLAVFVGAALAAIALVVRALQPTVRPSAGEHRSLSFFGDVVREASPDAYLRRLAAAGDDDVARDLATQVIAVARLLRNKYAALRAATVVTLALQLPALAAVALVELLAARR